MSDEHEMTRIDLMTYLDNELPSERAAAVLAHVNGCEECRVHLNQLRQVSLRLAQGDADALAAARLRTAATAANEPSLTWTQRLTAMPRWLWIAAPVAAVMLIMFTMTQRQPGLDEIARNAGAQSSADIDRVRPLSDVAATPLRPAATRSLALPPPQPKLAIREPRQVDQIGAGIQSGGGDAAAQPIADAPMIARTVDLALTTDRFADVPPSLNRLLATVQGSITALTWGADEPAHRTLDATLRVPAAKLDAALTGLRLLGRVQRESQSSDDVTSAHRDLTIRLTNARKEEARLTALLTDRAGKLSDVLAVEQQVTRVRTEIEQLDAEAQALRGRVAQSTITLHIGESYHADLTLGSLPLGARLRNALVDGARGAMASVVDAAMTVLRIGPTLLVWSLMMGAPAFALWHRRRRRA